MLPPTTPWRTASSSSSSTSGRERTIKGYVRDESGEMLVGVPICIGETRVCTVTDADGYYTFKIPVEQTTLKYSYVGMETVYVTVPRGTTDLSREIVLKSDVMLDEVLVTGYQQIEKGRATGSFEVVKPEQLKTVVSSDVVDNLEGVVPGLTVDGNGNLMVRGQATIYAETKPLIVVDGFPMEYGTFNVNPQDIESISVLKDAAAASIWGVRAANGVLVITTKKGTRNHKTEVSYNGSVKIGSRFDVESMNLINSADQVAWEREHIANNEGFISRYETYGAYYTEATDIQRLYENGAISESERDSRFAALASYDNTKDIEKAFYRQSLMQMHNITVSGGSANASNYLSFNFENNMAKLNKIDNPVFRKFMREDINTKLEKGGLSWFAEVGSKADDSYLAWLDALDRDNNVQEAMMYASGYKKFLVPEGQDKSITLLNNLNNLFTNKEIVNKLADNEVANLFEQAPANINDIYTAYCNVTPGREIPAQIQGLYDHYKTMVPGAKAVNFDMYDMNGKKLTLANLKGKAVYIDCWATWCGPCKAETPNMVKLYNHFKNDKRIQLVSISLDKNQAAWKSMVKKENLSWPQYIVKGEFDCMLCKEYGVTGIPRFMMFDKKGNIISLDAPRPSAPNIIEWIESNLK